LDPRRMAALVVAAAIVSGTGSWAVAKVVDITTTTPVSKAKPIDAYVPAALPPVVVAPPPPRSSTATPTPHSTQIQAVVHARHPTERTASPASAPAPAPAPPAPSPPPPPPPSVLPAPVPEPPAVAPVVPVPHVPSCDDGCGSSGGSSGTQHRSSPPPPPPPSGGSSGSGTGFGTSHDE
jgi:hypothetical protein